jgi:RNA polymerase sigma-70 factor (ECF subfamily)
VLARVARALRTFEYQPERGRFRDWLGTVTRHQLARFFARQRRGAEAGPGETVELDQVVSPQADAEWTAEFNAQVLSVSLERIRDTFEPLTWQAFQRVWQDGRPALDVSRDLGLPIDKVYAAKSRVLKRLREEILLLAEDLPHCVPLG